MGSMKVAGMDEATKFQVDSIGKVGEDVEIVLYPSTKEESVYRAG
jgi:hypothetical protein